MALSYYEQLSHPLWQRKRLEIFSRDDFKCLICGADDKNIQVHHLCYFPGMLLWEYDDELMKTVCKEHHEQLTYEMPKVSGLISFESLVIGFDLISLYEFVKNIKQ